MNAGLPSLHFYNSKSAPFMGSGWKSNGSALSPLWTDFPSGKTSIRTTSANSPRFVDHSRGGFRTAPTPGVSIQKSLDFIETQRWNQMRAEGPAYSNPGTRYLANSTRPPVPTPEASRAESILSGRSSTSSLYSNHGESSLSTNRLYSTISDSDSLQSSFRSTQSGSSRLTSNSQYSFGTSASRSNSLYSGMSHHTYESIDSVVEKSNSFLKSSRAGAAGGKAATAIGASFSAPASIALLASQAISDSITTGYTNADQAEINAKYNRTMASHKIGSHIAAESQRNADQIKANYGAAGSSIGGIFGPVGALAGYYIGKAAAPDVDTYKVDTFNGPQSFDGI